MFNRQKWLWHLIIWLKIKLTSGVTYFTFNSDKKGLWIFETYKQQESVCIEDLGTTMFYFLFFWLIEDQVNVGCHINLIFDSNKSGLQILEACEQHGVCIHDDVGTTVNFFNFFLSNTTDSYIMKKEMGGKIMCNYMCVCNAVYLFTWRGEYTLRGCLNLCVKGFRS